MKKKKKRKEPKINQFYTGRLTLKDVRVSWVAGELHKNGDALTELQVRNSLQTKHKKLFGHTENFKELSEIDLQDIIFKDRSRYRQKLSDADSLRIKLKKLELEAEVLKLRRLKEESQLRNEESQILTRKLMEESTPADFNISTFRRLHKDLLIMTMQSVHPILSALQCGMIVGSWVRRGIFS